MGLLSIFRRNPIGIVERTEERDGRNAE